MEGILKALTCVLENYGWIGLIVISLLTIMFFLLKNAITKRGKATSDQITSGFKEMNAVLAEQNDKLIDTIIRSSQESESRHEKNMDKIFEIVTQTIKDDRLHERQKHNSRLDYRARISETIDKLLWDAFLKSGADRAVVAEFHNSKENINGVPFLWYDLQYQKQDKGILPLYKIDQPTTQVLPILEDLHASENGVVIYNKDEIESLYERSTTLYNILTVEHNLKACIYLAMYNRYNKLTGFVAFDYINKEIPSDIDLDFIRIQVATISSMLQTSDDDEK